MFHLYQNAADVWMCGAVPILCPSARGSHARARLASDDTQCGFMQLGQEGGRYIACSVPSLLLDSFLSFKICFLFCVCGGGGYEYRCSQMPEVSDSPQVGIKCGSKLLDMNVGNRTWFLYKNSKHCCPLSQLFKSPLLDSNDQSGPIMYCLWPQLRFQGCLISGPTDKWSKKGAKLIGY